MSANGAPVKNEIGHTCTRRPPANGKQTHTINLERKTFIMQDIMEHAHINGKHHATN